MVSAEEFGKDLRHGQLIDVREKDEFKAAHILEHVTFHILNLKERFMELRKDQPIYLYEEGRINRWSLCLPSKEKWLYKYLHFKTWLRRMER